MLPQGTGCLGVLMVNGCALMGDQEHFYPEAALSWTAELEGDGSSARSSIVTEDKDES